MSAQSLLSSVFSCSSPAAATPAAAKSLSKRRLRQTRSLDPAIIGGGREEGEGAGRAPRARAAGSPPGERRGPRGALPSPGASFSTPSTPLERSPPGSALFDEESPRGKRSPGWELPFLARTPSASALSGPAGPANSIFSSPRRWLQQRKGQPSPTGPRPAAYVVWKSEGWVIHSLLSPFSSISYLYVKTPRKTSPFPIKCPQDPWGKEMVFYLWRCPYSVSLAEEEKREMAVGPSEDVVMVVMPPSGEEEYGHPPTD